MNTSKTEERVRLSIVVLGDVQGIGYRWFVQKTARELGLTGWVRNLLNGNVEIEAEGNQSIFDDFLDQLRYKHPYARVTDLIIEHRIPEQTETDFEIKY